MIRALITLVAVAVLSFSAQAAQAALLPSGAALGQGPASLAGGVPDGTHGPAVGQGGVVSDNGR